MAAIVIWDQNGSASVWARIVPELATAINTASKITDQQGNPVNVQSFIPGQGIVPLSSPGSGYLVNGCPLNVWFGSGWIAGQQDALRAAGVSQCLPQVATPQTGSTVQGGLTTVNIAPGTSSATSSAVSAAVSPSVTPGAPGSLPGSGGPTTQFPALGRIYRFILNSSPGRYDTGANYPGCSQVNTAMCDPQAFSTLQDALDYAAGRGEVPYIATSAFEVWGIIGGTIQLNPAQIYGQSSIPWGLIAAGVAALLLLR